MALNAKLHIETELRDNKTVLRKAFCTPPFKIANVTEDKAQSLLQLMLMSSSPGILDGDEYELVIDLATNCNLQLLTQSYQRLYQMKAGAKQLFNVDMNKGSSLIYIPHPVVPHENSIFFSKNKISMKEDCSLVWGEVMSCGRKLNGEVFKFSSYQNLTEVVYKDQLVVRENIMMRPAETNLQAIGQLEGYTHQASLLCIDEKMSVEDTADSIAIFLQQQKEIEFGVSALSVNGVIVRLLGYGSEQLFEFLKTISCLLEEKKWKQKSYVS